jgi:hypothetical protein
MVKQAATVARRVNEIAIFLLEEAAPMRPPPELPLVEVGVDDPENDTCIGFGEVVEVPVEELKPLASCAKPTEAGLARNTEYTFFRKVSPTIQEGAPEPPPVMVPISKIPPAHI